MLWIVITDAFCIIGVIVAVHLAWSWVRFTAKSLLRHAVDITWAHLYTRVDGLLVSKLTPRCLVIMQDPDDTLERLKVSTDFVPQVGDVFRTGELLTKVNSYVTEGDFVTCEERLVDPGWRCELGWRVEEVLSREFTVQDGRPLVVVSVVMKAVTVRDMLNNGPTKVE